MNPLLGGATSVLKRIHCYILYTMEEEEFLDTIENLENLTIEEIFSTVFFTPPTSYCTKQILPFSNDNESDTASFNFEILISLFMESMMNLETLLTVLCNNEPSEQDPDKVLDVYGIKEEYLEVPQPWFNSFGFYLKIHCDEVNTETFTKPTDHYCKVLLRDNPSDTGYFYLRKINKPFTFVLNADYVKTPNIDNIKAIFYKPKKDQNDKELMFTISFSVLNKIIVDKPLKMNEY
jgi:hypothetical protein